MIFGGIATKFALGASIALVLVGIAFYGYYRITQAELALLKANEAQLKSVIATQDATIKYMNENMQRLATAQTELGKKFNEISEATSGLERLFSNHDFRKLVIAKPGLIEPRINAATKKEFESLENLTDPKSYEVKP